MYTFLFGMGIIIIISSLLLMTLITNADQAIISLIVAAIGIMFIMATNNLKIKNNTINTLISRTTIKVEHPNNNISLITINDSTIIDTTMLIYQSDSVYVDSILSVYENDITYTLKIIPKLNVK